jgi:hypothetical protein
VGAFQGRLAQLHAAEKALQPDVLQPDASGAYAFADAPAPAPLLAKEATEATAPSAGGPGGGGARGRGSAPPSAAQSHMARLQVRGTLARL